MAYSTAQGEETMPSPLCCHYDDCDHGDRGCCGLWMVFHEGCEVDWQQETLRAMIHDIDAFRLWRCGDFDGCHNGTLDGWRVYKRIWYEKTLRGGG